MVIVFQVKLRTTSVGIFEKAVCFKICIFPYLFWNLIGPSLHTEKKANTYIIMSWSLLIEARLFSKKFSTEVPSGMKLNAFNWCNKWILHNYPFRVNMDILLSLILTMSFCFFRHWWLLSKPVSKQRNMYRPSEWLQLHLRAWLSRKELLKK